MSSVTIDEDLVLKRFYQEFQLRSEEIYQTDRDMVFKITSASDHQSCFIELRSEPKIRSRHSDCFNYGYSPDYSPGNLKISLSVGECTREIVTKFSFALKENDREIAEVSDCCLFSKSVSQSEVYVLDISTVSPHDATLKLCVTLHVQVKSITMVKEKESLQFKEMRNLLSSLLTSDSGDASINVEGEQIKCHKCILSYRSTYFSNMFESGLSEDAENQIEITDFGCETIKAMITYLYMFECPELSLPVHMDLLKAVDKYQILDLKDACQKSIIPKMDEANALDILIHADMYSATEVKKAAMDFIWKYCGAFNEDEICEPLMKRPHLLRDLLMAKFKSSSK